MDSGKIRHTQNINKQNNNFNKARENHKARTLKADLVLAKKESDYTKWTAADLKIILMPLKLKSDGAMSLKRPNLVALYTKMKQEDRQRAPFQLVNCVVTNNESNAFINIANVDSDAEDTHLLQEAMV